MEPGLDAAQALERGFTRLFAMTRASIASTAEELQKGVVTLTVDITLNRKFRRRMPLLVDLRDFQSAAEGLVESAFPGISALRA